MRSIVYALVLLIALPAAAEEISGIARVIDGDTIKIGKERIRLHGIDAPESKQMCSKSDGCYSCGIIATEYLDDIAGGKMVTCRYERRDKYGRIIGKCDAAGADIEASMVSQGWALAYRQYSTDYIADEDDAREAKRGIWRGRFEKPWRWRRGDRLACER